MDNLEKDNKQKEWVIDCYKCGAQNNFGIRYCVVCGEKFTYQCPQCGADIDPDYKVCPYCAVPINWGYIPEQTPPTQGNSIKKIEEPEPKEIVKEVKAEPKRIRLIEKKWVWLIAFIIVIICIAIIFAVDIFL